MNKRGPWLLVGLMACTVVALLAALLITGGDDGPDADGLVEAAPAAVDAARSAHLTLAVELESQSLNVAVDGDGAVDFTSGAGWFTVLMADQRIEVRTDGSTLFVLPTGQTMWLAVKADEASALGSFGTGPSAAIALIDLMRGNTADVEDLGSEEIDGAATRHVRLDVDLDAAIEQADERSRASLESLSDLAPDDRDLPLELWIDVETNLPVRQRLRGELEGIGLLVTFELTRWGEPLGVDIPPEGAIRDVEGEELEQLFGRPPPTSSP